jgi:ribonuclease HI
MRQGVVIHADESCLGNGRDEETAGGAGALIEVRVRNNIERRDLYLSAPDTTNNRMALAGAIAVLALLSRKGRRLCAVYVSDSQYLVRGMTEWLPAWKDRGWRRKGGAIENLDLWKKLDQEAAPHELCWKWVRGHAGHPKNEYTDRLAVRAATEQTDSHGAVDSGFPAWMDQQQSQGHYSDYDPDAAFAETLSQYDSKR